MECLGSFRHRKASVFLFLKANNMEKTVFDRSIYDLLSEGYISVRIYKILKNIGINNVEQLVRMSPQDLISHRACGRKAVMEIEDCLDELRLTLDMSDEMIDEQKGIVRPKEDKDMSDLYWKRLFMDLSLGLIKDIKDEDYKVRDAKVYRAIALAKLVVCRLRNEVGNIDKWINE